MGDVREVPTPAGVARAHRHAPDGRPRATLVLGHGAGRGVDSPDLSAIAAALPAEGVEVVLVEQPWRVAGRRVAGAAATLDRAWIAVLADLAQRGPGRPLVVGGRSAGARVACRTVHIVRPDGLLLLAFPLHAPGRRTASDSPPTRLPELLEAARRVPTVVVQGTRDAMGRADEVAAGLAEGGTTADVVPVPWADHAFRTPVRAPAPARGALEVVVRAARGAVLRQADAVPGRE